MAFQILTSTEMRQCQTCGQWLPAADFPGAPICAACEGAVSGHMVYSESVARGAIESGIHLGAERVMTKLRDSIKRFRFYLAERADIPSALRELSWMEEELTEMEKEP